MFIEDTITERSCMADYFSKFFDAMTVKHALKFIGKEHIIEVPLCQRQKLC